MNVSDVMRRSFATIKPDASLLEAASLPLQTNQRGIPVIDATVVGIIGRLELLTAVAKALRPIE